MPVNDGRTLDAPDGMAHLYPHQLRGEGHFAALLRKGYSFSDVRTALKAYTDEQIDEEF